MNKPSRSRRLPAFSLPMIVWSVILTTFSVRAAADAPPSFPEGAVHPADLAGIKAAFALAGSRVEKQSEGKWLARNAGQGWRTEFDGRGFLTTPAAGGWVWGLELMAYGFPGSEKAVPRGAGAAAEGNRMEYVWDDVLTEWFLNDHRGLEQGWTFHSRPRGGTGTEPLSLTLRVRGGLTPVVDAPGRSAAFRTGGGDTALTYSGLKAWDADLQPLELRFEAVPGDASCLRVTVEERLARYPVTIDPLAQAAYLKASNTENGGNVGPEFGGAVAVSGDTAVVGARFERGASSGVNGSEAPAPAGSTGAAYVFVRTDGVWRQQAYLKSSNNALSSLFGSSVAISGDTIVVGDPSETGGAAGVNGPQTGTTAPRSGAAYVFVRNGGIWTQQAYLKASNSVQQMEFGGAVGISGGTIVVGAAREGSSSSGVNGGQTQVAGSNRGAAYVFVRTGDAWSQQAYVKASNPEPEDLFGQGLAISGDTMAIAAGGEDGGTTGVNGNQANNGAADSGAVYVFVRTGSVWAQQAYIKASNTGAGDAFRRVALSGNTLVVGASSEDSASTGIDGSQADSPVFLQNSGAVYVFTRTGSAWTQQAYLKASNTNDFALFGLHVSIDGDRLLVGASADKSGPGGINGDQTGRVWFSSGAAYLFLRTGSVWRQTAFLKASNSEPNDGFGTVALSGTTALIGAPGERSSARGVNGNQSDNSFTGMGAVYVFDGLDAVLPPGPGDPEPGFAPNPNANLSATVEQPDGSHLLIGNFSNVAATGRTGLARFTPADALDAAYAPAFTGGGCYAGALQNDGRLVVGGLFTAIGGSARSNLARLNAGGTADAAFNPAPNSEVRALAILPDGRLLAGGLFTTISGVTQRYLARLNADGSLDTAFAPVINGLVRTLAWQPDGAVLIGGSFTQVNATTRNGLARLLADGSLDAAFNPNPNVGGAVYTLAVQPDGAVILGGSFTSIGGVARVNVARVSAAGALETAFNPGANGIVRSCALQTDGRIILGGEFNTVFGVARRRVARLLPNGGLDPAFDPQPNNTVLGVDLQKDGRVNLSGSGFTNVGGVARTNFARLLNDPATQSLTTAGTNRVQWLRGGASAESHLATLEISTDNGGTWSPAIVGTRIPGGWEFTGLSLPAAGVARARARTAGGYANGSSGLMESRLTLGSKTLASWRQSFFGTSENAGSAADMADPDQDGVVNLLEYAFALTPDNNSSRSIPEWQTVGPDQTLSFTAPSDVTGVSFIAEQSATLAAGSWTAIPNSATPPAYLFSVPTTAGTRRYLRLRVSTP